MNVSTNVNDMVAANMAHENGIEFETAAQVVAWLDSEGILDYDIVNEVYSEPEANSEPVQ